MNLFAILGPAFPAKFADATSDEEGMPWLDPDENVHPDDKPLPTEGGLFDEIPVPRDPYGCESPINQDDEE